MKNVHYIISILFVMIFGCAESRVTTLWKAKDIDFTNYRTIMILGPVIDADTTLRINMENHLIGDLIDLGYNAISANQEYVPDGFHNLNIRRINELLKNTGVEALVTIVLLKKESGIMFVPGVFYLQPTYSYSGNYFDFDKGSHDMRYNPGYYANYADYFWICSMYDMNSGKLAYSVQSYTNNVTNTKIMAHEYGQSIVRNMQSQGIIRKKNKMKAF